MMFLAFPGARPTERMRLRTVAWGRAARWAGVGATLNSPGVTSFTLIEGRGGKDGRREGKEGEEGRKGGREGTEGAAIRAEKGKIW